jgi:hypothetical protein
MRHLPGSFIDRRFCVVARLQFIHKDEPEFSSFFEQDELAFTTRRKF